MKIKKCGFLLSLVMLICFALPSFASAKGNSDVSNGVFNGKKLESNNFRYDLIGSYTIDGIYLYGKTIRASSAVVTVKFYNSKNEQIWSSRGYELRYLGSSHNGDSYSQSIKKDDVRYVEVSVSGGGEIIEFRAIGREYMQDILDFKAVEDYKKVTFNWINPLIRGSAISTKLYQDGKEIKTFNFDNNVTSYIVENLEEGKNYSFKMTVVNKDGDETIGITRSVRTLMPLVDPPQKVFVTPKNKKMVIVWDDVKSSFLKGYNVYLDGKKINDTPLISTKLIVNNLENDKSYKMQVSSVNKIDQEGEKSKEVSGKPYESAIEIDYDVVEVPFSPLDLLTSSVSLLALLGGFILLSIAIIWFKPLKQLIVKAARREKDKK